MFKDQTGRRFGMLVVVSLKYIDIDFGSVWWCQCDCGSPLKAIRLNYLIKKRRPTTNCGCQFKSNPGVRHGGTGTKLHKVWLSMKERCYRKNFKFYKHYGGRGIKVCDEWICKEGFVNFQKWAFENGYREGLSINRKDNDGNYCPENCEWTTNKEQSNNKRDNIKVEFNGEVLTVAQICEKYKLSRGIVIYAIGIYGVPGLEARMSKNWAGSYKPFKLTKIPVELSLIPHVYL